MAISAHFLWSAAFVFILLKNQRHIEKFKKTLSGSSPNYFLSHHTTFSQTQTGAAVPFRKGNIYIYIAVYTNMWHAKSASENVLTVYVHWGGGDVRQLIIHSFPLPTVKKFPLPVPLPLFIPLFRNFFISFLFASQLTNLQSI